MQKHLGVKDLVNAVGEKVTHDSDQEADMCELIRAIMNSDLMKLQVTNLKESDLDFIDCPGSHLQTEICAANQISYHQRDGWVIFFEGHGIQYQGQPSFQEGEQKQDQGEGESDKDKEKEEEEKANETPEERRKRLSKNF